MLPYLFYFIHKRFVGLVLCSAFFFCPAARKSRKRRTALSSRSDAINIGYHSVIQLEWAGRVVLFLFSRFSCSFHQRPPEKEKSNETRCKPRKIGEYQRRIKNEAQKKIIIIKKTTKTKHERWAHEIGVDGFFFWFFFGFFLRNEIFHVFHFSGPFFLFSFDFSSSFVATGGTMSFVLRPAAVERLTHCGGQSRWP